MAVASIYETELKFRIHPDYFQKIVAEYGIKKSMQISQAYLGDSAQSHDIVSRIRQQDDEYILCIKQKLEGKLSVIEVESPITKQQFEAVWPVSRNGVKKTRHEIEIGKFVFTFDVFHDKLSGLILAEVELTTTQPCTVEEALIMVRTADTEKLFSESPDQIVCVDNAIYANIRLGALTEEEAFKLINQ